MTHSSFLKMLDFCIWKGHFFVFAISTFFVFEIATFFVFENSTFRICNWHIFRIWKQHISYFKTAHFVFDNKKATWQSNMGNDNIRNVNPIQDGHFRGCSRMGEGAQKGTPLPKICHTYPTMMKLDTVVPYLKKIQKISESRDKPAYFCWHQHFFNESQQVLLYQEIEIWIAFYCIISNSFSFNWVFKDFFNKPGYNFDDVRKNGYPRSS